MSIVKLTEKEPVPEVVELLELLLQRAKAGEITALLAIPEGLRPEYHLARQASLATLGMVTMASQRLVHDLYEDNYD